MKEEFLIFVIKSSVFINKSTENLKIQVIWLAVVLWPLSEVTKLHTEGSFDDDDDGDNNAIYCSKH